jgi:hypothetical protein
MQPILDEIDGEIRRLDWRARRSLLYDLQHAVFARTGWKTEVLAGFMQEGLCHAAPAGGLMPFDEESHSYSDGKLTLVFEIYDPFFRRLRRTCLCARHREDFWEGDTDLKGPGVEVTVGRT